jgi:hypothetical protein
MLYFYRSKVSSSSEDMETMRDNNARLQTRIVQGIEPGIGNILCDVTYSARTRLSQESLEKVSRKSQDRLVKVSRSHRRISR